MSLIETMINELGMTYDYLNGQEAQIEGLSEIKKLMKAFRNPCVFTSNAIQCYLNSETFDQSTKVIYHNSDFHRDVPTYLKCIEIDTLMYLFFYMYEQVGFDGIIQSILLIEDNKAIITFKIPQDNQYDRFFTSIRNFSGSDEIHDMFKKYLKIVLDDEYEFDMNNTKQFTEFIDEIWEIEEEIEEETEKGDCSVCFNEDTFCVMCENKHVFSCVDCYKHIKPKICPLCRKQK